jgi:hypothetical protein
MILSKEVEEKIPAFRLLSKEVLAATPGPIFLCEEVDDKIPAPRVLSEEVVEQTPSPGVFCETQVGEIPTLRVLSHSEIVIVLVEPVPITSISSSYKIRVELGEPDPIPSVLSQLAESLLPVDIVTDAKYTGSERDCEHESLELSGSCGSDVVSGSPATSLASIADADSVSHLAEVPCIIELPLQLTSQDIWVYPISEFHVWHVPYPAPDNFLSTEFPQSAYGSVMSMHTYRETLRHLRAILFHKTIFVYPCKVLSRRRTVSVAFPALPCLVSLERI